MRIIKWGIKQYLVPLSQSQQPAAAESPAVECMRNRALSSRDLPVGGTFALARPPHRRCGMRLNATKNAAVLHDTDRRRVAARRDTKDARAALAGALGEHCNATATRLDDLSGSAVCASTPTVTYHALSLAAKD